NGGMLPTPVLLRGASSGKRSVGVSESSLTIAREGMRLAVTDPRGTAQALSIPGLKVAGKTGTAQVGAKNEFTNSLIIGFFPYEKPRYAFAIVMERAKSGTLEGAPAAAREVLSWLAANRPAMTE
ncbi:MAG: penicillin-binding transpeptidase domain-containing protein, partial [Patescibacteria group bacterium]